MNIQKGTTAPSGGGRSWHNESDVCEGSDDMATTTNVVNLDALIPRADLAAPGDLSEDIPALAITGLEPRGLLYPALRKPDFQRETASWTPEQVADLVITFVNRDLIPAVILWRAGHDVFVIDGAHRLSALIAWVHDDYGDRERSRRYFHNAIPEEQTKAADKARFLVHTSIGSYEDHRTAIESPSNKTAEIVERASRIGWINIPAQWIRNSDHEKAEKAFFRINQGGTKLDSIERRLLVSRDSPTALAARAILRAGTGHNYWNKFAPNIREKIEELGAEIFKLLYEPALSLPIKTLDLPVAGQGYGPRALPFVAAVSVDDLLDNEEGTFSHDVKGAAFLREALPSAPKCPTCGGVLHHNGMQVGHKIARREGGHGSLNNAMMQHPFCNSTVAN